MAKKINPQAATADAQSAPQPVRSMTGYGRAALEDGQRVTAEIRSVNGRYLKLGVKLPGTYGALEDRIRGLLNELGIKRGSIDVSLFFEGASDEGSFGISEPAIRAYAEQARELARKNKLKGDISIGALLPLPGVIKRSQTEDDLEVIWERSRKVLETSISAFNQMREREGASIAADIRAQIGRLAEHREEIRTLAPEALKGAVQKFKDRIARLLEQASVKPDLNPDALEREVVMLADRTDISEELARLESHIQQVEATLAGGGETGKKLDFLTQELFRETNTIGSKAQDERITHHVINMKGLIEKIREQVQNLE